MPGIDPARTFRPLKIAVLTVSDSRTAADDRSGDLLVERLRSVGHELADRALVPDEIDRIVDRLRQWIDDPAVEVVITTGGTGITGRDVTPEALEAVVEKPLPGFGELFRMISFGKIGSSALQSRATAGVAGDTYLFALPGSPGACQATAGTRSSCTSSTSVSGRATSPSCCRGWASAEPRRHPPSFGRAHGDARVMAMRHLIRRLEDLMGVSAADAGPAGARPRREVLRRARQPRPAHRHQHRAARLGDQRHRPSRRLRRDAARRPAARAGDLRAGDRRAPARLAALVYAGARRSARHLLADHPPAVHDVLRRASSSRARSASRCCASTPSAAASRTSRSRSPRCWSSASRR